MRRKELVLVAITAFVFGIAGAVMGVRFLSPQPAVAQEDGETVVAKQFVILNSDGNPAAMLTSESDGAGLYMYDAAGDVRALMSFTEENGPVIVLSHAKSKPGAIVVPNGMVLKDEEDNVTWGEPKE
jgi:lipoprotein-anchoring transpeptidase ErfK/SrfK